MATLQQMLQHNTTFVQQITPTSPGYPFYYVPEAQQFSLISDKYLNLAAPVLAYWIYCSIFHWLDTAKYPYFEKRRIHESAEVISRNKVTLSQVIKAVVFQHVIQVALGYWWMSQDEATLRQQVFRDHLGDMAKLAPWIANGTLLLLGKRTGEQVLINHGASLVRWVYWWGIPTAQMLFAFFIIDTWQYFWHRAMHTNRWLYRHFHSHHHRLYVSYAFGALYNHPVEGFILDTLGAAIAESVAGMTMRQATLLFTISTLKTVDDHCGYKLWWDPCQMFFANNADYHDIHHQGYGIKSNFSQPFFTNWDKLLGTRMSRDQANQKTRRRTELSSLDNGVLAVSPAKKME
ncbi:hypothetical protein IAU60_002316 [Kwoniella sp. DSM 27419]